MGNGRFTSKIVGFVFKGLTSDGMAIGIQAIHEASLVEKNM